MATALLSPSPKQQFLDNSGVLAAGFKLYTYATGTTTPQATYKDRAGTAANTNPIILDERGEAVIYLVPGLVYDYELVGFDGTVIWTRNGISADGGDAGAVSFLQAGTGAISRASQDKMRERVSVLDYGADPTGVADSTAAFKAARDYLQTNTDSRGGKIYVPRGTYRLTDTIAFTAYAAGLVHNIELEGDGPQCTVLDFSGGPSGSDGITFNKGAHFAVRGLTITGALRDGLVINPGAAPNGPDYCNFFIVDNVRSQNCGRDGIACLNAYLGTFTDCWAKANGRNGFTFAGFHTAIKASRCESAENSGIGYSINGMVYSAFDNCGSDLNDLQGYAISNVQGVVMTGCGAEANGRDGWFLFTSDTSATGLSTQMTNVRGLELVGCYGLANSVASAGAYGTFLGATTANSRAITVSIRGGIAHGGTGSDRAMVLDGASGQITVVSDGFDDAAFIAADSLLNAVEVQNRLMIGRRSIAIKTVAQTLTTAVQATMTLDGFANPQANDMGATIASNAIVIPRGVHKVKVTACVNWGSSSTGTRYMEVLKNGATGAGQGALRVGGVASLQPITITTGVLPVSAGDLIRLDVLQDSGGNLDINPDLTYLCVEALG